MAYTRMGNYLLASELSADPLGGIHRGVTTQGPVLDHNFLIRSFSQEIQDAGLSEKGEDIERAIGSLSSARGLGTGYRMETAAPAHLAWDYLPGRSLAQLIEKTRQEQIPLGIDHALSITQGVCQGLLQMRSRGLAHGVLSPHSIWVSFEGATQIADAPVAPTICTLLAKCPTLAKAMGPYRPTKAASAFLIDLYALGAMFFELLTLEQLPAQDLIPAALADATLKAAQDEAPIPAEIQAFLARLLLVGQPFESSEELTSSLESVLYDGDYSPTTFNMAFFMHTLFREENEQDTLAMKEDQSTDFTPYLPTLGEANSAPVDRGKMIRWASLGGVALILVVGGLVYNNHRANVRNAALQAELKSLRDADAVQAYIQGELRKQEARQQEIEVELKQKLQEEKKAEEKARIEKALEESRKRTQELAKAREEAQREQERLRRRQEQLAAKSRQTATPTPAPAQTATPAPAPAPAPPAQSSEAQFLNAVPARYPQAAIRLNAASQDRSVTVKVYVDSMGRPQKTIVVSGVPGSYGFDDAAVEAAKASTYRPASQNGRSVPGWVTKTYAFAAQNQGGSASSDCQMIKVAPVKLSSASRKFLNEDRAVTVKVYVDSVGRPQKVIVVSGVPGSGIDEAVRDSALASTYQAGQRDGKAVAGWVTKTYNLSKQ